MRTLTYKRASFENLDVWTEARSERLLVENWLPDGADMDSLPPELRPVPYDE